MTTLLTLATALGVALVVSWWTARRPAMWRRVAQHADVDIPRDFAAAAAAQAATRLGSSALVRPWGNDGDIVALALRANNEARVRDIRLRQLRASAVFLGGGALWLALRHVTHPAASTAVPGMILAVTSAPLGGWWVRARLSAAAQARTSTIDAQLPAVLDLVAFAIAAGDGMGAAIARVTHAAHGPLPDVLRHVSLQVAAGAHLSAALADAARATGSVALVRAVHAIDVATQRGTPLADVLRAQAGDARAEHLRTMLEVAGRREAAMMLPVVFLILPVIVLVAVYPGLVALRIW
mgnify:CR=1 FL=1